MLDPAALRALVLRERPALIVPEIEAIATPALLELEAEGFRVIPTARAARLTMDREGIRRLAAEELGLATSPYRFADTLDGLPGRRRRDRPAVRRQAGDELVRQGPERACAAPDDVLPAWEYAQAGGRAGAGRVIVEGFVRFDYEITLLTVRHAGGTSFCAPIGHLQVDGDYRESWQPQPMSAAALARRQRIARHGDRRPRRRRHLRRRAVRAAATRCGSAKSRRGRTTPGLVTLVSQDLSEFALHARAILGLPVPAIRQVGPAASCAVLLEGESTRRPLPRRRARARGARHAAAPVRQARGARQAPHGRHAGARRQTSSRRATRRAGQPRRSSPAPSSATDGHAARRRPPQSVT